MDAERQCEARMVLDTDQCEKGHGHAGDHVGEGTGMTFADPAVTETDLRAALEQARDRMETMWHLMDPPWSDDAKHGIAQHCYFGMEELDRALATPPAEPPSEEGRRWTLT